MSDRKPLATRPHLTDELARILRNDIVEGRLEPGQRLPTEQQLSETYGVSRAVVREAVSMLKYDGLVESRQGIGAFVSRSGRGSSFRIDGAELGAEDLALIFELRSTVEVEAAALAALRRTSEHIGAMERALADMQRAIEVNEDGAGADADFHTAIAAASGNHYFTDFMSFLSHRICDSIAAARRNSARHPGWNQMVQKEHQAAHEAIKAGDEAAARAAMQAHLVNAAKRLNLPAPS